MHTTTVTQEIQHRFAPGDQFRLSRNPEDPTFEVVEITFSGKWPVYRVNSGVHLLIDSVDERAFTVDDDRSRYMLVRIPDFHGTPEEALTDAVNSGVPIDVVEIWSGEEQAQSVREVRAAYEAGDYDSGDEIRQGVEEDLYQVFADLVPDRS